MIVDWGMVRPLKRGNEGDADGEGQKGVSRRGFLNE